MKGRGNWSILASISCNMDTNVEWTS